MGRVARGLATAALLALVGACSSLPEGGTVHVVLDGTPAIRVIDGGPGLSLDQLTQLIARDKPAVRITPLFELRSQRPRYGPNRKSATTVRAENVSIVCKTNSHTRHNIMQSMPVIGTGRNGNGTRPV